MQIPHAALSPDALQGLLEEFVTREGTDYGNYAGSLADKVAQVRRQLDAGKVIILYDPETATCHIDVRERLSPHIAEEQNRQ